MNTENLSTLIINQMSQKKYNELKEAGDINSNELYLTPDEEIVDPAYNPESKNAQSGIGLAPVFQKKFELWRNDKKYKSGDMVLAICAEQYSSGDIYWAEYYLAGMKCISDQDPVDVDYPNLMENFSYHWNSIEFNAKNSISASHDGNGKLISGTYATKEEVNTAIGNINTVLSKIVNGGV